MTARLMSVTNVIVKSTDIEYIILCLYVDDILIVGSNNEMVKRTKDMLNSKIDMKDMGLANVILSIKIKRSSEGLILTQSHYVDKILGKFSKNDFAITLIDTSQNLFKNRGESVNQVEYARVIGSIIYLMNCTRLDILGNYGLHYSRDPVVLEGFSDASWISNIQDTKGTSGYVFTLGGEAVSWKSSRQTIITRSAMESEFVALDKYGEEAM
ncbi:Zinc finger, CCHC-type [Gossypium australe]|uniref:Zinc finger, CCHC-type n=1 Tax=Gossypium australe TaxID=47621 RepID=A0A5B6VB82_9ROSI|nr:Zinc finger, CCHC-type [Gossypium australe]